IDDNAANHFVFFEQRDAKQSSGSCKLYRREAQLVIVSWLNRGIGYLVGLFRLQEQTQAHTTICAEWALATQKGGVSGRCALSYCADTEEVTLPEPKIAKLSSTDSDGFLQHGFEHRLQITGRVRNDAQHIGGCGLLPQRFAELTSALSHFLLKVGVGFLQTPSHNVELIGQRLNLVAGLDCDAVAQVAG